MAEVKVLIKGYAREKNKDIFASSTVVLVKENKLNVVVDPGMDRKLLLDSLKKENLPVKDIGYIILTHYHLDHSLLSGIFENAKILDNSEIFSWTGKIEKHNGKVPQTNIKIVKTPGHDMFHCSVLVNDEKLGKVAIVGDVFWWFDEEEQKTDRESLIKHEDPYLKDKKELMESRKKILEIADYVIP